jgi:glutathione S-transferase
VHEVVYYVAVARFWHFAGMVEQNRALLPEKLGRGYHALTVMEEHLGRQAFLVAERYTIADIARYAYTHVAKEGGFELARFPAVNVWLGRVRSRPGYVAITDDVGKLILWP